METVITDRRKEHVLALKETFAKIAYGLHLFESSLVKEPKPFEAFPKGEELLTEIQKALHTDRLNFEKLPVLPELKLTKIHELALEAEVIQENFSLWQTEGANINSYMYDHISECLYCSDWRDTDNIEEIEKYIVEVLEINLSEIDLEIAVEEIQTSLMDCYTEVKSYNSCFDVKPYTINSIIAGELIEEIPEETIQELKEITEGLKKLSIDIDLSELLNQCTNENLYDGDKLIFDMSDSGFCLVPNFDKKDLATMLEGEKI